MDHTGVHKVGMEVNEAAETNVVNPPNLPSLSHQAYNPDHHVTQTAPITVRVQAMSNYATSHSNKCCHS